MSAHRGDTPQAVGERVRLYLGDCLEIMKTMADASVDCVVTDPPYGNGTPYASYDDSPEHLAELVAAFMPEVLRVAKRALITCGVANIHLYPTPKWVLSWSSPAGIGSGPWGFCCWQPILAYGKDPYMQANLGRRPDSFMFNSPTEPNGHPCPKPLEFMRWLVRRGSLPGESVIDPFMGSGTTGLACRMEGRDFVGIELDAGYFEIAKRRIERAQLPLILEPIV